jgi:hypothetical protein
VFFVWIADRWDARRYAFHVMILFNIMVLGMFGMVTTMYPKFIRVILVLLLVGSVASRLNAQKYDLYDEATMYGRLSKAYAKIVDHIDPEKEVVIALYYHIFSYYLDGIPENTKFIHIKNEKQLSREELIQILHDNKQGWIVWPYYKNWHIRRDVLGYIQKHFRNESPRGSKTVLYYFNRDMMENPKRRFKRRSAKPATKSD